MITATLRDPHLALSLTCQTRRGQDRGESRETALVGERCQTGISSSLSQGYNSAIWFRFTSATVSLPNIEIIIFTLLLSISVILPV